MTEYTLGALPSPPDQRDYRLQAVAGGPPLPARLDWGNQSPIRHQGKTSTCVAQALAAILEHHLRKGTLDPGRLLSPPDAYDGARSVEMPTVPGAYPRAALKWLQREGVCPEADRPTLDAPAGPDAARHRPASRVLVYARVAPADLKQALQDGPVLAVVPVTPGFAAPVGGVVAERGERRGSHAIVLVGYDDATARYRLRNSWGTSWGEGGYAWLPYGHTITEAWSLRPALSALAPPPAPPRPWWAYLFSFWKF